ncbi:MAG: SGNH/GDSL hydrolase family protein [Cytophagales bacterium]|nr:SGNH/GDSL hydrolase family protein [Cytophagales bacterium]
MTAHFLTRLISLTVLALSTFLAACSGSTSIYKPFVPTRVVIFGDALSDTTASAQYTVNTSPYDASVLNNWARQVAASYGVSTIVSYAKGNARITNPTGAAGTAVMSITAQTAKFLSDGYSYQEGDLVIINAGFSDVIAEALSTSSTANAAAAGTAFANLVRSLVAAGAKHVLVSNMYDLSITPAAIATPVLAPNLALKNNTRGAFTVAFNDALKSNLGSASLTYIGDNVYVVDAEFYMNQVYNLPNTYLFTDAVTVACNSPDAGAGIGLGIGQINSRLCTASTLNAAATSTTYSSLPYDNYVFADAIYPTPAFHRAFGSFAYSKLITRW